MYARGVMEDFSKGGAYLKFVNKEFVNVFNTLNERPEKEWLRYSLFEKTFITKKDNPQDAPLEMKDEKEPMIGDTVSEPNVYFDLQEIYRNNFETAKTVLMPIIRSLHIASVNGKDEKDLLNA